MKRILLIMFLFCIAAQTRGQYEEIIYPKLDIHIAPMTVITWDNARFQIGIEYHDIKHLGIGIDFGYGHASMDPVININRNNDAYEYLEIRPSLKYYFGKAKRMFRPYLGLEGYALFKDETIRHSFYLTEYPKTLYKFEEATSSTTAYGINGILGLKILALTHLTFDFYLGYGYADININYRDYTRLQSSSNLGPDLSFWGAKRSPGSYLDPSYTIGFKCGLFFNCK